MKALNIIIYKSLLISLVLLSFSLFTLLSAAAISHPTLLFQDIRDIPGYQYRMLSPWKDWEKNILYSASSALTKNFSDPSSRISSKADDSRDLALAYQITKNSSYGDKAKEALLNLDIGNAPYKVDKAWALGSYSLAYDWIQPYLDSASDIIIRDKLATLADAVYYDLNDGGANLDYISFADYHGQAYPSMGIVALALYDYTNPNNLPLSSTPSDWLKVGTEYLFVNDKLHKYNRSLFSFGFDESSGKHLNGQYKSYVIDDFVLWFQVYSHFFGKNIFDEYPMAKRAFTSEIWESLPNHYHNNYVTSGNTKWYYHKGIINLLDDEYRSYAINHVNLVENSNLLPYSSGSDYLPSSILYIVYGDYSSIPRKFPTWTSRLDKNSIYQVFRGSWADDGDWLSLVTWNITTNSNRDMAHHDQLSFEYYNRGDLLLADGGENKYVLDKYYGEYEVHHNTIAIENPRNPFPLSSWSNSPARGIYKGDAAGLVTAAQIESIVQTPWIEFLEANATVTNVIRDSWYTKQSLSSPVHYKRTILYPNKDYFIIIDRLEGSEAWIYRNIFRPTSLNIKPSISSTEVGNVIGSLAIGGMPYDWLSLPYKTEISTGINTNSIKWNTINPYGNSVYMHLFSVPSSEIRLVKHVGRIAGYDLKSEVFSPVVYFRTVEPANNLYRITALLSRYSTEEEKIPEELSISGRGSALKIGSSMYQDYIYSGSGESSFDSISTNAETLYLRKKAQPSEYILLNGSYIYYSNSPLLTITKKVDYLTLKQEQDKLTFKVKSTDTIDIVLYQMSPGTYQVKRNGILYTNWELTDNKMKITTDLGEQEFEIKRTGEIQPEIKFTYNLHPGWNLISLPLINYSFTAKTLTEAVKTTSKMEYFDSLPKPYDNLDGFWNGSCIYSYGGDKGTLTDEINVYCPSTKEFYTLTERLPSPRDRVAVAYNGTHAFIFGGSTTEGLSNQILWHDILNSKIHVRPTTLPYPVYSARAVWDGRYVYILGGNTHNESTSNIITRYDPQNDTIEVVLTNAFPYSRWYTTAIYVSSRDATYMFGGRGREGIPPKGGQILKYNHTTNKVSIIGSKSDLGEFGCGQYGMTAVKVSDESIYIFGGVNYTGSTWNKFDDVWLFNTTTETLTKLSVKMPYWQNTALGVYDDYNNIIYLIGGAGTSTGVDPIANITRLKLISGNSNVQFVVGRDATGNDRQYIVGFSEDIDDFAIKPDLGYYIYLNNDATFSISGTTPGQRDVGLKRGWNLIGWTSLNITNASTLIEISNNNIRYVAMRNDTTGEYQTYIADLSREEDNFLIEPGRGYFVYAERDCTLSYGA